jgi:DNA-binding CsgD family transcriptional regulator
MGQVYYMMGNTKQANAHWMDAATSGSLPIREASLASLIKLNPNKVELYKQFYSVYKQMPHVDSDELSAFQMRLAQQEMQHETYIRTITLLYIIIGILLLLILSYLYYHHKMKVVRRRLSDINARYLGYLEDYNNAKCNIEELKNKIVKYQEDKEAPENWSIENMLLNADVVISLHRIASRGQCANEVNWQQLTQLISERDKSMAILLSNNPELSDREQHVVMLIRLRFIPSEISVLMDVSAQNVTNMRQRLMQKMFGENGGARDFDHRIHELQRPQF